MHPGADAIDVTQILAELFDVVKRDQATNIGFPGSTDFDYRELAPFLTVLLNNVGDPYVTGAGSAHSKQFEAEVVDFFADLFRLPSEDRWGYITSGGSEANLYALHLARDLYPTAQLYFSVEAHDSVPKAAELLRMSRVAVRTHHNGEMDYDDLRGLVERHRDRPAIVVATLGTTMTEAVDDPARIAAVLRDQAVRERFIHADAALAGVPYALDIDDRPDIAAGLSCVDSLCISGHKFLGAPVPCGVVLTRDSMRRRVSRPGSYTGSPDTTVAGSRSGLAALMLWYRLHQLGGTEGLRKRVTRCRELAEYALRRLVEIGWPASRNPGAFTVVMRTPPPEILSRWALASHDGWSHLICVPGVERDHVDNFIEALRRLGAPSTSRHSAR